MQTVKPYHTGEGKKYQVQKMFDAIAGKYDFLNHFLSFGIDRYWRKNLIDEIGKRPHGHILDIATGTGDLAIKASGLKPDKITGIDISENMLEIGRQKISKLKLGTLISLQSGDAENLPFPDNSFDVVMVAFGIRNFENLGKGFDEIYRVLKKDGLVAILEFSKPARFPVKQLYRFYSRFIMPFAGKSISGDAKAYSYLPESVKAFPEGEALVHIMNNHHFANAHYMPLTFRIVSLYFGNKV
jgi:demethylmenaquinone methyltransferase / 2-methoxy-6-polyprenyl-1,4-benzoquinol methylase